MTDEPSAGKEGGFLGQLFDFSFTRFITTRIIKVLYGLALFFGFAGTIGAIVGAFSDSVTAGVITLVLSPLWLLLYAIVIRVLLEMAMVVFRMAEHVGEIARQSRTESWIQLRAHGISRCWPAHVAWKKSEGKSICASFPCSYIGAEAGRPRPLCFSG